MSGGGKGGSQSTSVKLPAFVEDAAKRNLARADEAATIGYVPYYGADVAAFTPMQEAAFGNTNAAAGAFGLGTSDPMAGMPQVQTFANGTRGYSSAPMYEESLAALAAANPGQYAAIQRMFIDPQTGRPGGPMAGGPAPAAPGFTDNQIFGPEGSGGGGFGGGGGGGNGAGFTGFRDMVNGGGPGASGGSFQGGGLLSGVGNMMGGPKSNEGGGGLGGRK